jgi:hypothetical protein
LHYDIIQQIGKNGSAAVDSPDPVICCSDRRLVAWCIAGVYSGGAFYLHPESYRPLSED